MALLLSAEDLARCLSMADAIGAIEEALAERKAGTSVSPPRETYEMPPSAMTITPGGFRTLGTLGLRVYIRGERQDQLTAVWNARDGRLEGAVVGPELGQIRTGAIGGVAMKCMAPANPHRVGIVGGGPQSWAQLLALRVVRPSITEIRLYRRDATRRKEVARRWKEDSGLDVRAVETAKEAVDGSEVIVLATDSSTPVIEGRWIVPGTHVSSLGPKYRNDSEIGLDTLELADWLACDFPEQYLREKDFIGHGSPVISKLRDLAELAGSRPPRAAELRTLFLSHGLAGTEVAVAHQALLNAAEKGIGKQMGS
jgi:ornithine cyclodeaminase/alanine dehydrogenase-like protein (mu-crystallin family)